jgi:hypothetical protein
MTSYFSDIAARCPVTIGRFTSELFYGYGVSWEDLTTADAHTQYLSVLKYFGYSKKYNLSISKEDIIEKINDIFDDYETILMKYAPSYVVPDPIKIISNMSNQERTKYLEENYKYHVLISLHNALASISHFNRPSLSDCLIARVRTTVETITAESAARDETERLFWEQVKKDYAEGKTAPF